MGRDYSELIMKIRGKYLKLEDFASDLGINSTTLNNKLMGRTDWKREEMIKAAELLGLSAEEILHYFF